MGRKGGLEMTADLGYLLSRESYLGAFSTFLKVKQGHCSIQSTDSTEAALWRNF